MSICQGWCRSNSFTRKAVGLMFLPNLILLYGFGRVKLKILSCKGSSDIYETFFNVSYYEHRKIVIYCDQNNMVDYKNVNYVLEGTVYSIIHNITC